MTKLRYERPIIKKLNYGTLNKFGNSSAYPYTSHIEGVAVRDLIQQYGSPLFVISERKIRHLHQDCYRAFSTRYPKVQMAWSYKTNYLNAVCQVFHQEGAWAEVVSGFEYQKALKNGVVGSQIIFNGPDKTEEELRLAIENESMIHIDHFDELYKIVALTNTTNRRPKVAIRVNMDTGVYPMWDRFGFNYETGQAWDAINKIMTLDKMDLVGLHCHIGTFMLSPSAYSVAAYKLSDLALGIKKKFRKNIEYIDLGGGFPSRNTLRGSYLQGDDIVPTFDDFAEVISSALFNVGFESQDLPLLILETGRALVDEAGFLLGTVLANKRLSDGRRATIMDFGVNLLFTSFWYEHKITPAQESSHHTENSVIYGPLCMNIDVIRENASLPLLNRGDQVVVHTVGAYNMTQWMQFISLRPNVVMIDMEGKVHLIRANEELSYLMHLEQTPTHLSV